MKLSKFRTTEISSTSINFIKNDSLDNDASDKSKDLLIKVWEHFNKSTKLTDDVYIFETSHGFIADFNFKFPVRDTSLRLNKQDLKFLNSMPNFRWVESHSKSNQSYFSYAFDDAK